jgi:hypothetical protein
MSRQSTRYLLLIEPAVFGYNPETASTNMYQVDARESEDVVYARALNEFHGFRDALVAAGVSVMTMRGPAGCPDALFPNWMSTHEDGTAMLYPMMAPNRRRERSDDLVGFLSKFYALKDDFASYELQGRALESTGSFVLDRVNRVAYVGRSARTDEGLARLWCTRMNYEPIIFDTVDHKGKPIYHTDLVIWIGTSLCAVGSNVIVEADRDRVMASLSKHREVIELDNNQIRNFCGNSIEVRGTGDQPMMLMSDTARGMLTPAQISLIHKYNSNIIAPKIPTIETYGGGSARCLVQELF